MKVWRCVIVLRVVILLLACTSLIAPVHAGILKWSYSGSKPGTVVATASYPSGNLEWFRGAYDPGPDPKNPNKIMGLYGQSANGEEATDTKLTVTRPANDPELSSAFIMGSPGSLFQAEISEALLSTIGLNEFDVPMLFNDSVSDIFAAVDLAKWLANPPVVNIGDVFSVTGGVSSSLPGFIVGTSPIRFSSDAGWITDNPFTGSVTAIALVDGSAIPDLSPFWETGSGALGLFLLRHIRRRRARSLMTRSPGSSTCGHGGMSR
jgi:hypothetical protein